MNTKLLRKIAKVIIEKPRQFNMDKWHNNEKVKGEDKLRGKYKYYYALCDFPKEKQISCDTTHCIGGWAQALSPDRNCEVAAEKDAKRLLEITLSQADRLFYCDNWPEQFQGKRVLWKPTRRQAADRIEHFIKTAGKE